LQPTCYQGDYSNRREDRSLSEHPGPLDLDGLTTLSDAAAESLSKHTGGLELGDLSPDLDNLPVSVARNLRQHPSVEEDD